MIWLHGRERLDEFLLALNSYHESIKFTWEIGNGKISFLDVMISFNGRKFSTDVYHKPTDTHQYLNFKSCHPQHVKKAIPYSQALRLKRICDSEDVYKRREKESKGFLWKRGYERVLLMSRFSELMVLIETFCLTGRERDIQIGRIDWF